MAKDNTPKWLQELREATPSKVPLSNGKRIPKIYSKDPKTKQMTRDTFAELATALLALNLDSYMKIGYLKLQEAYDQDYSSYLLDPKISSSEEKTKLAKALMKSLPELKKAHPYPYLGLVMILGEIDGKTPTILSKKGNTLLKVNAMTISRLSFDENPEYGQFPLLSMYPDDFNHEDFKVEEDVNYMEQMDEENSGLGSYRPVGIILDQIPQESEYKGKPSLFLFATQIIPIYF